MRPILSIIMICLLVSLNACKEKSLGDSFQDFFKEARILSLEKIPFEPAESSPFFSNMFILGYIDSVIVVNELLDSDFTFKLIDLKSGRVKKFGKRGEGPNELLSDGGYFLLDHENNHLIIGDGYFNYVYKVEELFDENVIPIESFRFETGDDRLMGHRVMANGSVFGSSYLKRFASYDISESTFDTYEDYPGGESQALAHQAYFLAHPNEFRIAYGMRSFPEFGIISEENDQLEIKKWNWGDINSKVEESSDGTRASTGSPEDELHFFSTAGGNKSIFFLHSGAKLRYPDGRVRREGLLTDKVYQLDWNGNPIAVLNLGQEVKAIAVDPEENYLYASTGSANPELLIFKLP
ncbi:TolB-like 6-bladed beta-propeller domain-containing protein [Algoriphagus pacificus]|uniref:TolB-like 6-blade propeller-like n=1 Tax=Algoriphagus pacificus TaxID=2811234 RepID=A0ABS3CDQ6_9BACT|nr:hypothetical protein [Algoriphagus pacificus]MBN7815147.1 hypothetical protein [Algoriphagus pacificus]